MALVLDGTNGETLPSWTTGTRPSSPLTGQAGYNTTLSAKEVWNGSAWVLDSIPAAGTSGNVLTDNGTTWTSQTLTIPPSGQIRYQLFTAPGTFTTPSSTTQVRVTVIGGGGSGGWNSPTGQAGSTSSFSTLVSATGGGAGVAPSTTGSNGTGTVSTGTAIMTGTVTSMINTSPTAIGYIWGNTVTNGGVLNYTYTATGGIIAGAYGSGSIPGGKGGVAIAICPVTVSTAYPITVGSGGPNVGSPPQASPGASGAVLVEYVG